MDETSKPRFWRSPEERDTPPAPGDEFPEPLNGPAVPLSRRGFLQASALAAGAVAVAGCSRAPVEKAIPHLIPPEELIPGRSSFYASTCGGCSAGCGILAEVRDGRPIKLEGNPDHPLSRGGLCAVGQAALAELYDSARLRAPRMDGRETSWDELDRNVMAELARLRARRGALRLLSGTMTSPTLRAVIRRFLAGFDGARHVSYDALSASAIAEAHERTHGLRVVPRYRFDRAEAVASFDADFLGTWISPVEFTAGWRAGRNPDADPPRLSFVVQFEARYSLTGGKADRRVRIAPHELAAAVAHLAARLASLARMPFDAGEPGTPPADAAVFDELAERLWGARGRCLVVSGSQDAAVQVLVNFCNHLLENYGRTVLLDRPSQQRAGDDRELESLLEELRRERVDALILLGANPVAELPGGDALAEAIGRVPVVISLGNRLDETTRRARFLAPDHHPLESWADAEPVRGLLSLSQPAIRPLGQSRAALESLAAWSGEAKPAYDILRAHWLAEVFPRQRAERDFERFWQRAVHDGFAEIDAEPLRPSAFRAAALPRLTPPAAPTEATALVLYPAVAMQDGRHAHNPWLQELPDPVTKVVWDNCASLSPAAAARLGLKEGDVARLEAEEAGQALDLPVQIQPGQHDGVVAVALGYGREETARFAELGPRWISARSGVGPNGRVGVNAAPLLAFVGGALRYDAAAVRIVKTGRRHPLATTQTHHRITGPADVPPMAGRPRQVVEEMTLAGLLAGERILRQIPEDKKDLYPPDHAYAGRHWGMVIDTEACTGCSACVVACQAENNIPVVGKDEVRRHREMHWLRIDRYYSGDGERVEAVHQPMLCQQCDYAPCETVCPVLATVHSDEGLNQQVYNRCVGTRYCANNCPYKTRRFNWFDYQDESRLENLALNPDVTVRSRGVMEKCTFCVQRIQEAKIEAKRRGAALADGEIRSACQQSCPARAIAFGDMNDPESEVSRWMRSRRYYRVLEEFNFRPSVGYLAVVRQRAATEEKQSNG
jgi:molybdopterin-containing oxidoreductase family iron-sulfur binding subunit